MEKEATKPRNKTCSSAQLKKSVRFLLYMGVMILYLSLGALLFSRIESLPEVTSSREQGAYNLKQLEVYLWNLVQNNVTDLTPVLQEIKQVCQLRSFEQQNETGSKWDFASSLLFTTSVITTIGYGNLAPSTEAGQALLIIYALFGIPLNLAFLLMVGKQLSMLYKKVYKSVKQYKIAVIGSYMLLFATGWAIFTVLPAIIYSNIEGWSFTESLYFSVVTLTTIGFGDYTTGGKELPPAQQLIYNIWFVVWVFLGMAYLSLLLHEIGEFMTALEKGVFSNLPAWLPWNCVPNTVAAARSQTSSLKMDRTSSHSYTRLPTDEVNDECENGKLAAIDVTLTNQLEKRDTMRKVQSF